MKVIQESMDAETITQHIKRAFWRLQYKVRKHANTEFCILQDNTATEHFETNVVSRLDLKSIFDKIPSAKARYIIFRTVLQRATEKQVAHELKISQQAVNKCKTKALKDLRMKIKTLV